MTQQQVENGIRWIRILKLAVAAGVLLMVFFAIVLNLDHLNGDDIRRFAARINFGISGAMPEDENVVFTDGRSSLVARYKDGLAVVADDRLKVYDATGIEFFNTQLVMNNPCIDSADKYILVFDRGGHELGVFNSFSQVVSLRYEGDIINASVNSAGALAVAHKTEGYRSQLTVYGASFSERYKWYSASTYILQARVWGNCQRFAAAGITLDADGAFCEVLFFLPDTDSPTARTRIDGAFVYDMSYIDRHTVSVVTDAGWAVIDADSGELVHSGAFAEGEVLQYDSSQGMVAYTLSRRRTGENLLITVDCATGSEQTFALGSAADSVAVYSGGAAVVCGGQLVCFGGTGEVFRETLARDEVRVLAGGSGRVIVASGQRARFVTIR